MLTSKWFCEKEVPGKRFKKIKHCFLIEKLIYQGKSRFQKILIFKNPIYGKIFVLDGILQFSELDEFIYHEMITHPILFSHPNPKKILIIGGGDGGALREVLKHPVESVDLVEVDEKVLMVSKKYLSFLHQNSFSDKRLKIYFKRGEDFLKDKLNLYDVVIVDSTNLKPGGISFPLYSKNFYQRVFKALKKEGMMITLGASFLDFENLVKPLFKKLKSVFPFVVIFRFCMPSYHCGEYSFLAASKKIDLTKINPKEIERKFNQLKKKKIFKYYSPKIHFSSLVLPEIWKI